MMIKICAALLSLVGAASADEFSPKMEVFLKAMASDTKAAKEAADAAKAESASLKDKITALETANKDLKAQVDALPNKEAVEAAAKAAGSKAATDAVAGVGFTPPAPPSAPAKAGEGSYEQLMASAQYDKAFAVAPENIKAEFIDEKNFAAYQKANKQGRVRIVSR